MRRSWAGDSPQGLERFDAAVAGFSEDAPLLTYLDLTGRLPHPSPARAAEILGPGTISTAAPEFATSFTADDGTVYFNRASADRSELWILTSGRLGDGSWSPPEKVPFTGVYRDVDPFVSADGSRLFYSSNRPAPGETEPGDFDLWVVDRDAGGTWSEPKNLGAPVNSDATEIYSTLTRAGHRYFTSDRDGESGVYRSRLVDGHYTEPERLVFGGAAESAGEWENPAIAPDESFLVVSAERPGGAGGSDLYVSFRRDGAWSAPQRLAAPVSSPYADFAPCVSWDGSYLYWTSERPGQVPAGAVEGRPPDDLYRVGWQDLELPRARQRE